MALVATGEYDVTLAATGGTEVTLAVTGVDDDVPLVVTGAGEAPLAATGAADVPLSPAAGVAPVISNFCFGPIVCRAARVALFLATASVLVATVFLVDFRGFKPKTARLSGD